MPMYAGEILELVQTLLERTLERCRAAYTEVVYNLIYFCLAYC
jgi:exocyst complex component 4